MTDLQDLAVNRAAEVILSAMLGRVVGDRADKIAYDAAQSLLALGLLRCAITPACRRCGTPHYDSSMATQPPWTTHIPQCRCSADAT